MNILIIYDIQLGHHEDENRDCCVALYVGIRCQSMLTGENQVISNFLLKSP